MCLSNNYFFFKINIYRNNKEIIKDWAEVSSIHGVPHIAAAKTKFVKCIWISILIFCFTIFMILFLNGLVEYLGYPTVVNFESRSDEIDFPAVTFCHASPYSMKKIENSQYKQSLVLF